MYKVLSSTFWLVCGMVFATGAGAVWTHAHTIVHLATATCLWVLACLCVPLAVHRWMEK